MKKSIYLSLLLLVSISVQADDYFSHGGIRYKIESFIDQELRVTNPDESDVTTTELVIPESIKTKQGQVWTIVAIGDDAFCSTLYKAGYKCLRKVTIPKSVKKIHPDAFRECTVSELTVNCAVTVPFKHLQQKLKTLNLGPLASFSDIAEDYFVQLASIRTITVSPLNKAFSVVDGVLYNKAKTLLMCFPQGKEVLRMPNTVERFACGTTTNGFPFCHIFRPRGNANKDIREIHFSPVFKEICSATFQDCSNLKTVTLPSNLKSIGYQAFYKTAIENIILPNSLTKIGNLAFSQTNLSSITIPSSVSELGTDIFRGCSLLRNVTLPNTISVIPNYSFTGCTALEAITIPNSVKIIGENAFWKCSNLKDVVLGNAITEIRGGAFSESGITHITLPSSLVIIGSSAFKDCKLTEIKVPASVKEIDCYAFGVPNIVVYCYPVNPPSNRCSRLDHIFNGVVITSGYTLHIPKGSKENYLQSEQYRRCAAVIVDDL